MCPLGCLMWVFGGKIDRVIGQTGLNKNACQDVWYTHLLGVYHVLWQFYQYQCSSLCF